MATSSVYVTLPIVVAAAGAAAAAGLCFFDRKDSKSKELGGHGIRASIENIVRKAVVVELEMKTPQMPKLAPQFDGLDCFETFVGQ